jgi:hypothetical protein
MRMRRELDEQCELMAACAVCGVDAGVWVDHFGMSHPGTVSCCECDDLYRGLCEGGKDPVVCMQGDLSVHMRRVHGRA